VDGFWGDDAMEDSVVQEELLDDVDDKDCVEELLDDVEREDVDDDPNDDVEGNREEGYKDLLDDDRLYPLRGVEGTVGGGVRAGVVVG
jgi:hypothetical protein